MVAVVDLVVERDDLVAELDVLRARARRRAPRIGAEDELALLLEARLERVELAPGTRRAIIRTAP